MGGSVLVELLVPQRFPVGSSCSPARSTMLQHLLGAKNYKCHFVAPAPHPNPPPFKRRHLQVIKVSGGRLPGGEFTCVAKSSHHPVLTGPFNGATITKR